MAIAYPQICPDARSFTPGDYANTAPGYLGYVQSPRGWSGKPFNAELDLQYEDLSEAQAALFTDAYADSRSGFHEMSLGAEASGGIGDAALQARIDDLSWKFASQPVIEPKNNGLFRVSVKLISELPGFNESVVSGLTPPAAEAALSWDDTTITAQPVCSGPIPAVPPPILIGDFWSYSDYSDGGSAFVVTPAGNSIHVDDRISNGLVTLQHYAASDMGSTTQTTWRKQFVNTGFGHAGNTATIAAKFGYKADGTLWGVFPGDNGTSIGSARTKFRLYYFEAEPDTGALLTYRIYERNLSAPADEDSATWTSNATAYTIYSAYLDANENLYVSYASPRASGAVGAFCSLVKLSTTGQAWAKRLTRTLPYMIPALDGSGYLVGGPASSGGVGTISSVFKIDNNGDTLTSIYGYRMTAPGQSAVDVRINSLSQAANGDVYATTFNQYRRDGTDYSAVIRLDANLNTIWVKHFYPASGLFTSGGYPTPNGRVSVAWDTVNNRAVLAHTVKRILGASGISDQRLILTAISADGDILANWGDLDDGVMAPTPSMSISTYYTDGFEIIHDRNVFRVAPMALSGSSEGVGYGATNLSVGPITAGTVSTGSLSRTSTSHVYGDDPGGPFTLVSDTLTQTTLANTTMSYRVQWPPVS